MIKSLLLLQLTISFTSFSQSKKEQIDMLGKALNNLYNELTAEKKSNDEKDSTIKELESQIESLNINLNTYSSELISKTNNLTTLKTEIDKKNKELVLLKNQMKLKSDSIEMLSNKLWDIQKVNSYDIENSEYQFQEIENIKIGSDTWMLNNLNTSFFKNGDLIPRAKTNEEWKLAAERGKTAWCYYDNHEPNGLVYGKIYNWYAVNDSRGLVPDNFHIPDNEEWTKIKSFENFNTSLGGFRDSDGNFMSRGYDNYWWSSSNGINSDCWYRSVINHDGYLNEDGCDKGNGFYVIGIQD